MPGVYGGSAGKCPRSETAVHKPAKYRRIFNSDYKTCLRLVDARKQHTL